MSDAATIAVVGVLVVISALAVLMLAIMVITRLVPGGKDGKTNAAPEEVRGDGLGKADVAAVAVAMALAMAKKEATFAGRESRATAPGHEVSHWASAGRERLMHSRRKKGRKWGDHRSSD